MSVPVHERTESQLAFLANAESLQDLTNKIVMNEKYVPKKYRYVWTQEVFKLAMNIFENTRRANIIYPKSQKDLDLRLHYLILAESDSEALLSQIAFAQIFRIHLRKNGKSCAFLLKEQLGRDEMMML